MYIVQYVHCGVLYICRLYDVHRTIKTIFLIAYLADPLAAATERYLSAVPKMAKQGTWKQWTRMVLRWIVESRNVDCSRKLMYNFTLLCTMFSVQIEQFRGMAVLTGLFMLGYWLVDFWVSLQHYKHFFDVLWLRHLATRLYQHHINMGWQHFLLFLFNVWAQLMRQKCR